MFGDILQSTMNANINFTQTEMIINQKRVLTDDN